MLTPRDTLEVDSETEVLLGPEATAGVIEVLSTRGAVARVEVNQDRSESTESEVPASLDFGTSDEQRVGE